MPALDSKVALLSMSASQTMGLRRGSVRAGAESPPADGVLSCKLVDPAARPVSPVAIERGSSSRTAGIAKGFRAQLGGESSTSSALGLVVPVPVAEASASTLNTERNVLLAFDERSPQAVRRSVIQHAHFLRHIGCRADDGSGGRDNGRKLQALRRRQTRIFS